MVQYILEDVFALYYERSLSSYNKNEDSIVVIGRVQSLQDDQKVEMLLFSFSSFVRVSVQDWLRFRIASIRTGLPLQSKDLKGVTLGQTRIL